MKRYTILLLLCCSFEISASPVTPRNPYQQKDELRREKALQEKEEESLQKKRLMRYAEETQAMKNQIATLTQQISQKDSIIAKQTRQISELEEKVHLLESVTNDIVYTKPFYDVYLGELVKHLNDRIGLEVESGSPSLTKNAPNNFTVKTKRSELKSLKVYSNNNKIYEIVALYLDASDKNFRLLKRELDKTFKPETETNISSFSGDAFYSAVIDDIPILIILDHVTDLTNGESLSLRCIHKTLYEKAIPGQVF